MIRKIIAVSGPSCAGKTPLLDAVEKYYPDIEFKRPVLYTSREPRPHEKNGIHYHFRSIEFIQSLPNERFVIAKTRQHWQAIDLQDILKSRVLVVFDIHPALLKALQAHSLFKESGLDCLKIFIQPHTFKEISNVADDMQCSSQQALAAMRTPHLITRALKQGKELLPSVLSDIHVRANAAWEEYMIGRDYDIVLVNHDGEDSDHWNDSPPSGQAGEILKKFVTILKKNEYSED